MPQITIFKCQKKKHDKSKKWGFNLRIRLYVMTHDIDNTPRNFNSATVNEIISIQKLLMINIFLCKHWHYMGKYRVIINDCTIVVGVQNPHKFWMCRSLATLDKLVDRFSLPPVAPPIGDTSLTHVMRLAAHSTTSPTPTAMGQSFIMS
jgi:hypothetical protein